MTSISFYALIYTASEFSSYEDELLQRNPRDTPNIQPECSKADQKQSKLEKKDQDCTQNNPDKHQDISARLRTADKSKFREHLASDAGNQNQALQENYDFKFNTTFVCIIEQICDLDVKVRLKMKDNDITFAKINTLAEDFNIKDLLLFQKEVYYCLANDETIDSINKDICKIFESFHCELNILITQLIIKTLWRI